MRRGPVRGGDASKRARLVSRGRTKGGPSGALSPRARKLVSKGKKHRRLVETKSFDSGTTPIKDRLAISVPRVTRGKAKTGCSKTPTPSSTTALSRAVAEECSLTSFRFKTKSRRAGSVSMADDRGTPKTTGGGPLLSRQKSQKSAKHVDHFTLGIRVGSGLGDCYLGLQKLENSLSKQTSIADDINAFLLDLTTATGTSSLSPKSAIKKGSFDGLATIGAHSPTSPRFCKGSLSPEFAEECADLLEHLRKTTREVKQRMKGLNGFVGNLHTVLEQMDEAHSRALEAGCCVPKAESTSVEDLKRIQDLEVLLVNSQAENSAIKSTYEAKLKECQQTEEELLERENELDKEVAAIEKHQADVSAAFQEQKQRLMQDREHFKKDRQRFQQIVEAQQREWQSRQQSLGAEGVDAKKLVALQQSVIDERKKLHKEKKAMAKERKKLKKALERGGLAVISSEASSEQSAVSATSPIGGMYHGSTLIEASAGIPLGGYGAIGGGGYMGMAGMPSMDGVAMGAPMMSFDESAEYSYAGSEYAETVISDGMTDLQSLDSFGSDSS